MTGRDEGADKARQGGKAATGPQARSGRPMSPEEELAAYLSDTETPDGAGATASSPKPAETAAATDAPPAETIESLRAERDAFKDKYLRSQAEMSNAIRRLSQQQEEAVRLAGMGMARGLLPVLDNLRRVLDNLGDARADDPIATGVRMIADMLAGTLREHGIEPIDSVGAPFDPRFHEAVMQDPDSPLPPGTVSRELERGYRMRDRVLRYAKVAVASAREPAATP